MVGSLETELPSGAGAGQTCCKTGHGVREERTWEDAGCRRSRELSFAAEEKLGRAGEQAQGARRRTAGGHADGALPQVRRSKMSTVI